MSEREGAALTADAFGVRPRRSVQARIWPAKASLNSSTSISSQLQPGEIEDLLDRGNDAEPRSPRIDSCGRRGYQAQAGKTELPPLVFGDQCDDGCAVTDPQELPAVTVPPSRNAGFNLARRSTVSPDRGRSSAPSPPTGTTSSSKAPRRRHRPPTMWERAAYASWRSRLMPALGSKQVGCLAHIGITELSGANGARS